MGNAHFIFPSGRRLRRRRQRPPRLRPLWKRAPLPQGRLGARAQRPGTEVATNKIPTYGRKYHWLFMVYSCTVEFCKFCDIHCTCRVLSLVYVLFVQVFLWYACERKFLDLKRVRHFTFRVFKCNKQDPLDAAAKACFSTAAWVLFLLETVREHFMGSLDFLGI